jgi:hypothetical protein
LESTRVPSISKIKASMGEGIKKDEGRIKEK